MAKRVIFEEGQIFSIEMDKNKWTLGQLCNLFIMENSTYKQWTLAFFDYLFTSEDELKDKLDTIKLDRPIIIATTNGNPVRHYYGLKIIGKREIDYINIPDYKNNISTIGLYNKRSIDFDILIKAFFGILPYDCFYKDDYVDEFLVEGSKKRNDIKCLKDFSIEELKKLLPENSIKLKKVLENEKTNNEVRHHVV
jgi:hypothetical protein